jgi:hypothetical protein
VKWKGGEEKWEPYENVAETEALDEYKRLHGTLTVDTVDAARGFASAANANPCSALCW